MCLSNILLILVLMFITYQDFRYRFISIWTLPVLLFLIIDISLKTVSAKELMLNSLINLLVFALEILLLIIYFSIKNNKVTIIFDSQIGTGDVLFITVLCSLFSPLVFFAFIAVGLCLTLLGFILAKVVFSDIKTIPLAGSLSLLLLVAFLFQTIFRIDQIYNISFVENLLLH